MSPLDDVRLYLVAGPSFGAHRIGPVVEAGVGIVQLRDKEAEAVDVLAAAEEWAVACRRVGVPFVVNDRPDIAAAAGADGVHLGQADLPPRYARRLLGSRAIVGRSTHTPEQVAAAIAENEAGDVDYIAVGPVHETPTKPGRPAAGLELVRHAAAHVRFPWFAIGGISPGNVDEVIGAGATRVVVVRAITDSAD
ncbi:MAG TPA: thiamine phosphate synthase, partial [Actinomycetota bacterium]|nr:thiamine phosphate synthase [Actinomycetota bacterium]